MAKDVAVQKEKTGLPASLAASMEAAAGRGMENVTTEDVAIPFLRIIQKTSASMKKTSGEYRSDASEGMILNTVTGQLFDGEKEGILVVPCGFNFKLIEWTPIEDGGGFVGTYSREDPNVPTTTKNAKGQDITADGNILSPTAEHFVLLLHPEDGTWEQCVIAMSSTQLKKSRKWNSMMGKLTVPGKNGPFNPPIFSSMYRLTTVPENNDSGEWAGWVVNMEGFVQDENLFKAAMEFNDAVSKGVVEAKHTTIDGGPVVAESDTRASAGEHM